MNAGVKAQRATARRVGLAAVLTATLATGLLTSGCAAGQVAQTANESETLDGTIARVGNITLGGLAIETPTDGTSWAKDSNVPLKVVIVNGSTSTDKLTGITSPQIAGWNSYASAAAASAAAAPTTGAAGTAPSASGSSAPITIPGNSRVQFATEQFGGGPNRVLLLNGVNTQLHPGMAIDLTFSFASSGTVTVRVPVQLSKSAPTSIVPGPSATGQVRPAG